MWRIYKWNAILKPQIPENRDEYLTFIQKSTFTLNRPHNCLTITPKHSKHRNTVKTQNSFTSSKHQYPSTS